MKLVSVMKQYIVSPPLPRVVTGKQSEDAIYRHHFLAIFMKFG